MNAPAGGDEPAEAQPPANGETGPKVARLARVPIAFVAGAAALTVTLFQLHDRIWPPVTVHGGEVVSAELVEVGVSYVRYVTEHKLLYPDKKEALKRAGNKAVRNGAVVNVVVKLQGLRGRKCNAVYTVYRTPLTPVIGPDDALEECGAQVQDGDQGGWPAWVELPRNTGRDQAGRPIARRYFIRFDLFDDNGRLIGPGKNSQVFGWNGETITP